MLKKRSHNQAFYPRSLAEGLESQLDKSQSASSGSDGIPQCIKQRSQVNKKINLEFAVQAEKNGLKSMQTQEDGSTSK